MKMTSIALAAAFAIGAAAPAVAADYYGAPPPTAGYYYGAPPPAPPPMTCMDYVNAYYGAYDAAHSILAAPFYATHALVCHTFHYGY